MLFMKAGPGDEPRRPRRARARPAPRDRRGARRPHRRRHDRRRSARASTRPSTASSTAPGSCSRRPSSTRTCTCARPGREDEETIASGHRGGRRRRLRRHPGDAEHRPGRRLRGRVSPRSSSRAARRREIPVGFLAAITRGQQGDELTEMGELADAGAAAFSDDGRPVASPGLMRRALQYSSITGRSSRCTEERLALARRADARGRRLGRARLRRLPVGGRVA